MDNSIEREVQQILEGNDNPIIFTIDSLMSEIKEEERKANEIGLSVYERSWELGLDRTKLRNILEHAKRYGMELGNEMYLYSLIEVEMERLNKIRKDTYGKCEEEVKKYRDIIAVLENLGM